MSARRLGRDGPEVSAVGLGCNNFGRRIDLAATRAVVDAAIESGVTLFDTANIYGDGDSERFLGQALGARRDEVVVATKFGLPMVDEPDIPRGSARYIRWAVEGSLRRLGTDRIDLYQYHKPDGVTPPQETLGELDALVGEGKVLHIGSSQHDAAQVQQAEDIARKRGGARYVSAQNHYSLLERDAERELLPTCERLGIGVLPFFPLANGLLTGKYRRGRPAPQDTRLAGSEDALSDDTFDRLEALERFAADHDASLLELAIGGLLSQPAVSSVIAGATKPEQVRANVSAGEWRADVAALRELAG